jgi:hypothetical protein
MRRDELLERFSTCFLLRLVHGLRPRIIPVRRVITNRCERVVNRARKD